MPNNRTLATSQSGLQQVGDGFWLAEEWASTRRSSASESWRRLTASGRDAMLSGEGRTVRCTPERRTVRLDLSGGEAVSGEGRGLGRPSAIYLKLRPHDGSGRGARQEAGALLTLAGVGLQVAPLVGFGFARGLGSVLLTEEVPGRSLDSWVADPATDLGRLRAFVLESAVPSVQRLHSAGLCYRDLYWNHLYSAALDSAEAPAWIDAERAFRPRRWRWRRWWLKDVAGLVSSWPLSAPGCGGAADRLAIRDALLERFELTPAERAQVLSRAERVRARQPKFG